MPRNPDKIDYSQGFLAGFRSFEMIKDPRSGGHTLHHFGEILFVGDKSNEITAIPELLKMLNLQGAVVTIDAMGTQREIATKIVEKGGDYILYVKGNQGNLHKEISDHFEFAARQLGKEKLDPANWSHAETLARSHGRNERRQTIACHYLEWMDADIRSAWTGLETLIMVSRDQREAFAFELLALFFSGNRDIFAG